MTQVIVPYAKANRNGFDNPISGQSMPTTTPTGHLTLQLKADELRLMLNLTDEDVQGNLDAISQLSLDAVSAAASPMLHPSSPALRGRSPSPNPAMLRV